MAERVMVSTAQLAKGKIPPEYRLTVDEVSELTSLASNEDIMDAFMVVFRYGFVLGTRAAHKGKVAEL